MSEQKKTKKRGNRRHRHIPVLIFIAILLSGVGISVEFVDMSNSYPENSIAVESTMEVHFLDMGQSDSTLIMCDGETMLIDAGDEDQGTKIQNYLKKQGIKEIDYLVLTHPDADHIGSADVIVTKFDVNNVFMSYYEKTTKTYNNLLESLKYKNYKWTVPKAGDSYELGSAVITIIGPVNKYDDPNNASIVLSVKHGDITFLFTGDAEEEAEADMLEGIINLDADVLKVGHHGSRTSSTEELLDAVNPHSAVISCGIDNSYGFPHAKTLNNLRARGIEVYRTDNQGTIVAISDGKDIEWNCAPDTTWQVGN